MNRTPFNRFSVVHETHRRSMSTFMCGDSVSFFAHQQRHHPALQQFLCPCTNFTTRHPRRRGYSSLGVRESRCSWFSYFVIAHFNSTASTFRDWFRQIEMRPSGCQGGLLSSDTLAQITPSSVNVYLVKWGWMLLCFMEWSLSNYLVSFILTETVLFY